MQGIFKAEKNQVNHPSFLYKKIECYRHSNFSTILTSLNIEPQINNLEINIGLELFKLMTRQSESG